MKWLVVILLVLFLVGCSANDQGIQEFKKEGYPELTIDVRNAILPDEVFQERPFAISFLVKNDAYYDAENVKVDLVGFDNFYVDVISGPQQFGTIEGKSLFSRAGGVELAEFELLANSLQGAEYRDQNYRLSLMYSSKVDFTDSVCVGPPQNLPGINNGGCEIPKTEKRFNGQGAPVGVDELQIIPSSSFNPEIELRMKVKNRGDGEVANLRVGKASLGNLGLDCEFRGESDGEVGILDKDSEETELICKTNFETRNTYTTTLSIELLYDYQLTIRESLRILK